MTPIHACRTVGNLAGPLLSKAWARTADPNPPRTRPPASWWASLRAFVAPPAEVADGIYVGSAYNAASAATRQELGVVAVVNVTTDMPDFLPGAAAYANLPIRDVRGQGLDPRRTTEALDFMAAHAGRDGAVLCHCFMGASRSVVLCALYLVCRCGDLPSTVSGRVVALERALATVRAARPIANVNLDLVAAARQYLEWRAATAAGPAPPATAADPTSPADDPWTATPVTRSP